MTLKLELGAIYDKIIKSAILTMFRFI